MKNFTNWAKPLFAAMLAFCVSTTARAEWVEDVELITNADQMSSNCQWNDGYPCSYLIDGNHNTHFHSDASKSLFTTDEWLQVDLERDDVSRIIVEYWGRNDGATLGVEWHDNPTKIMITATNMPDDEDSWVEVTTLDEGFPDNVNNAHYTSPMIDLGTAYRYLRFHIQNTSSSSPYWNLSEFQVYTAVELDDNRISLQNLIDSIYGLNLNIGKYDELGYFSGEAVEAYNGKLTECLDLIDDKSATQEALATAMDELRGAVATLKASVITPGDGNWFIYSANPAFAQTRAMYASGGQLRWGVLDTSVPTFYFNIKKLGDGNYIVRNLYDGSYIGWGNGEARAHASTYVTTIDADTVEQQLTPTYEGTFYISNSVNPAPNYYHPMGHSGGSGKDGQVFPAAGADMISQWTFVPADTAGLAQKAAAYPARVKAEELAQAIDGLGATALLVEMKAPATGLVKTAAQLSSNCAWNADADVDKLVDGSHDTYFHSDASSSLLTQDEWLQIDLGSDGVSKLIIDYYGRDDSPTNHDTPNALTITATNTPGDDASWAEITNLTSSVANESNARYVSPVVSMGAAYRYVRLHIKGTTSGNPYWNISELQLYNAESIEASENSYYGKNAAVKAAVDAMEPALAAASAHIAAKTVDGTELEPIEASVDTINAVLAMVGSVQAAIDEANSLASSLYVVDADKGLITEVNTRNSDNQLSSNCTWTGISEGDDNYPFNASFIQDNYNLLATLIDNDDQTYWRSDPTGFNVNTQNGFFQIDLKRDDVSSYVFMLWRRNDLYEGSNRHGQVPKSLDVYATNDAGVGTSLESENSAWTSLGTISGIPGESTDGVWPYYTAAVGDGTAYRYLRVRFHDSSEAYIGLSGFNVYDPNDMYSEEKSQYLAVDGMKAAADRMQSLAASAQAKIDGKEATAADGGELEAAIAAVRALYQDHGALSALIARAQTVAGKTVAGEEMGQLKDEAILNTLNDEAIPAAQEAVANINPSTAEFNAIADNLQKAIDDIYANLVMPDPGKWYNIVSNSTYEYATGQPMYLNSTSTGAQLKIGEYPTTTLDIADDPYALFRFVTADASKGTFYIQNMGTGQYFGAYRGMGAALSPLMSHEKTPYRLWYDGEGGVKLQQLGVDDIENCLKADRTNLVILNFPANSNRQQSWLLTEVPEEKTTVSFNYFLGNNVSIMTLPWATKGSDAITAVNPGGFQTYAVKNVSAGTEGTRLELTKKQDFEAGEPMVIVAGDPANYDGATLSPIKFNIPETVTDTSAIVANGLVGTLEGTTVAETGLGYFAAARLAATTGRTFIDGRFGYIDPSLVQDDTQAGADLVITTTDRIILNSVKSARVVKASDTVDVYTTDGVIVRKGAKAANATDGLAKGVYIIGKEKVLVR